MRRRSFFGFVALLAGCVEKPQGELDRCPNGHYQEPVIIGGSEFNGLLQSYCSLCRVNYMTDWNLVPAEKGEEE